MTTGPNGGRILRQPPSGAPLELLASLVANDSDVPGLTVRDALNNVQGQGSLAEVENWYISGTGNDSNDGLTPSTPIQSKTELNRRIGSAEIQAPVCTVWVLSDLSTNDAFFGPRSTFPGSRFIVEGSAGAIELVPPTVVAASNMVTGTRRWIDIGIDWAVSGLIDRRVRVVASPTPNKVGALCWIRGAVSGSPLQGYVSRPETTSTQERDISPGDTIVVERLPVFGPTSNNTLTAASFPDPVTFRNVALTGTGSNNWEFKYGSLVGCKVVGVYLRTRGAAVACLIDVTHLYAQDFIYMYACSLKVGNMWGPGELWLYDQTESLRALALNKSANVELAKPVDCWGWAAGPAVSVNSNSTLFGAAALRGTSAIANTYGVRVRGGCRMVTGSVPTIQGALAGTKDFEVAGADGQWGVDYPVADTAHAAFLVPSS